MDRESDWNQPLILDVKRGREKVAFTWIRKSDLFSLFLTISVIKSVLRYWRKIHVINHILFFLSIHCTDQYHDVTCKYLK
ncbi:MAG TPA: hypothetical protein DCY53_11455 [Desulfobacteraceae bacterium]|nr:hypothetical protein [Desulfobacteraceae bacterium]